MVAPQCPVRPESSGPRFADLRTPSGIAEGMELIMIRGVAGGTGLREPALAH
jgi:hypothetical protein